MKSKLKSQDTPFSTVLRLAPMIIVMGAIFFLSHQPGGQFHIPPIKHLDKFGHFFLYAILAVTVLWAFSPHLRGRKSKIAVIITMIVCLLYGISDEIHQYYIPGRMMSGGDVIADLCGSLAVCAVWAKRNLPGGSGHPGRKEV